MSAYGEFDFIASVREMFDSIPDNGFEGIGDDCSVLPIGNGESLLFTSDMLNEGVHFLAEKSKAYQIGYKSLMVNISDVAAMGAKPIATLLSLSLPKERFGEWSEAFMEGFYAASTKYGVKLVGGDTTASVSGICISVTAIGRVSADNIKRRSSAEVGDIIAVTGKLGASAAGLRRVIAGEVDDENSEVHLMPEARVREGMWLGEQSSVRAMMDISDGIASDLLHILKASKKSAIIVESDIPVANGATLNDALCGGEDYELLFTIANSEVDVIAEKFQQHFGKPLYIIGRVVESKDDIHNFLVESDNGLLYNWDFGGFHHF